MPGWRPALAAYLAAVNLAAFALCGWDKRRAIRRKRRVPERRLLGLAAAGGAVGLWAGMRVFHHKTLHKKFTWGVPCLLAAQLALAVLAAAYFSRT